MVQSIQGISRFLIILCFILSSVSVGCLLYFKFTPAIVYVDSGRLLNGYKGMVEARKEYDKKRTVWQSNVDTLTNDVKKAITEYSKDQALGTSKEQSLSKELIQTKQKELADYQNAIRQNATDEESRLNQQVFTTINGFLLRWGKDHGYRMVLIAANGNIAYADPALDVTDKVVEELNKEYTIPGK